MCNIGKPLGTIQVPKDHPVLAYREWDTSYLRDMGLIRSVFAGFIWHPGWQESGYPMRDGNVLPDESNYVGFFGYTRAHCLLTMSGNQTIKGAARLAGQVVIHERGVRAQYAQPAAFVIPKFFHKDPEENKKAMTSLRESYTQEPVFHSSVRLMLWVMRQPRTVPSRKIVSSV